LTLELKGVQARLQGAPVLHAVDLALQRGEVLALLGRNGAGKTTTLRTIMGLTDLSSGQVTLEGMSLGTLPTWQRARTGLYLVPEDGGVFQEMTVLENLRLSGRGQPEQVLGAFPELRPLWQRRAALLSGGERKILALARAALSGSRWLLIDEPSLGLAPAVLRRLGQAIREMRATCGILLVEQNLRFAQAVADRYVLMQRGATVDRGQIADLRQSPFFAQAMSFGSREGDPA